MVSLKVQLDLYITQPATIRYRRNWLLSACAYSNRRQETMRLIRSMRLTASVRLIERADIEGGANDLVRFKTVNNRDRACRVREPSQALAFFDENLLDSLGPRV